MERKWLASSGVNGCKVSYKVHFELSLDQTSPRMLRQSFQRLCQGWWECHYSIERASFSGGYWRNAHPILRGKLKTSPSTSWGRSHGNVHTFQSREGHPRASTLWPLEIFPNKVVHCKTQMRGWCPGSSWSTNTSLRALAFVPGDSSKRQMESCVNTPGWGLSDWGTCRKASLMSNAASSGLYWLPSFCLTLKV